MCAGIVTRFVGAETVLRDAAICAAVAVLVAFSSSVAWASFGAALAGWLIAADS